MRLTAPQVAAAVSVSGRLDERERRADNVVPHLTSPQYSVESSFRVSEGRAGRQLGDKFGVELKVLQDNSLM